MVTYAAGACECPACQRGIVATKAVMTPARDVTDTVLSSIDLGTEKLGLKDHQFRLRRLEIKAGGPAASSPGSPGTLTPNGPP